MDLGVGVNSKALPRFVFIAEKYVMPKYNGTKPTV
jgi:hypothetical protein